MYELKKNGKVFTIKSVGTWPSSYGKSIYRATVSQILRKTALEIMCEQLETSLPMSLTQEI